MRFPVALRILFLLLIAGAIGYFWQRYLAKNRERRRRVNAIISKIETALSTFVELTSGNKYFSNYDSVCWNKEHGKILDSIDFNHRSIGLSNEMIQKLHEYQDIERNIQNKREIYNKEFVSAEKMKYQELFNTIEDYPLDQQQISVILHDEDNTLVIAGAGTGKTTTIIGKVEYLVNKGLADTNEILVLAFTAKAANEMKERLIKRGRPNVSVKTFHSFGYDVIGTIQSVKPNLAFGGNEEETKLFLNEELKKLWTNSSISDKLADFFSYLLKPEKEIEAFNTLAEYYKYIKAVNLLTFNGELVKSFEELKIANFLFRNGIEYKYEKEYEHNSKIKEAGNSKGKRAYQPDFYLPEYSIYIEHFGIDREGNVPKFFNGEGYKSATEIYTEGMEWKRQTHKKYGTTLVETYSYQNAEENLLNNLRKKLVGLDVVFNPIPHEEVLKVLERQQSKMSDISLFVKLLATFLALVKSNMIDIGVLKLKVKDSVRSRYFLEIFESIYSIYESRLKEVEQIDYNDMIVQATDYIDRREYVSPFRYIIIDEFQDMSVGRYTLIKTLRDQNPSQKVFCVGDDWQSIFRFAGSDISITTQFVDHFGFTHSGRIETAYRSCEEILLPTSNFIQKNPAQLRKKLKASHRSSETAFEILYTNGESKGEYTSLILEIIYQIGGQIMGSDKIYSVFIIGRYNFNCPPNIMEMSNLHPQLKIEFYTAHKAKGLTCDFTIVTEVVTGWYGFPTEINDDPILNLVLHEGEHFDNAEERRLFYVALTRARIKNYILTDKFRQSRFVLELKQDLGLYTGEKKSRTNPKCPNCEDEMIERKGPYSSFWGCSNYPLCNGTLSKY